MTNHHRYLALAATMVATALVIAACGSSKKPSTTSASKVITNPYSGPVDASATTTKSPVTSTKKSTLLVYSAQGYDMNTVLAFSKATGIPAKLVDDHTGPLLARIQAEKEDPQWGLIWIDGNASLAYLDQEGFLRKGLTVPTLNATGQSLVPADRSYLPTGVSMACTIIYNVKAVPHPPTSWQGLYAPSLKGKVGMNNPAISGPTYPCVAGLMQYFGGIPQGEAYLEKLKANGLKISDTNGDTLHLLETGQIDVGLVQSTAALGTASTYKQFKVVFLPDVTVLPSAIAVDAHVSAPIQQEALAFISYVFSPAGQHQMLIGDPVGDSVFWPVVPTTTPKPFLPALASLSKQILNPYTWGPREATIDNWFVAHTAS